MAKSSTGNIFGVETLTEIEYMGKRYKGEFTGAKTSGLSALGRFMVLRNNITAASFTKVPDGMKGLFNRLSTKNVPIFDDIFTKEIGGVKIKEMPGFGVTPDVIRFKDDGKLETSDIKGIVTSVQGVMGNDDRVIGGNVQVTNAIKIAGGEGTVLTGKKEFLTGFVQDSTAEGGYKATTTEVGRYYKSFVQELYDNRDNQDTLKKILSRDNINAKALRTNYELKSGLLHIPMLLSDGTVIKGSVSFPWKNIKNNKAVDILVSKKGKNIIFNIKVNEAEVRRGLNAANDKWIRVFGDKYEKEVLQYMADEFGVLSPKVLKYLTNNTNITKVIEHGKSGAVIQINSPKEEPVKKATQSPQQRFISGAQISALVRKRLTESMDKTGRPVPPDLKYRTGRYANSVTVVPNYKTKTMSYTINPLYRSLEQYGYTPDDQAKTAIREVVTSLYQRNFIITRSN